MKIHLQPLQGFLNYLVEQGTASWIGFGGSRGCAKSGAIRRIAVSRCAKYPNTSRQIIRRVWDDVEKNHVNKMWEEFPELRQYYNTSSHAISMPEVLGGGKIFFDSAEHKGDVERKAYGPEFFDIFVDQAEQFTEDELTQLKTTCRWPSTPDGTCKFVLTFNPGNVGAAFLQRIFHLKEYHEREKKDDYAFLQGFGWDNIEWSRAALAADGHTGDCLGAKCGKCASCVYYSWDSEKRFRYYIERTQYGQEQNALPAHKRAGQLLGDFTKFAGQYFSNFDPSVHVWDPHEIVMQNHWPIWASIDWGYSHSTSVHWHCQAGYQDVDGNPKKLVVTFREYVTDHLSERALAQEIVARNNGLKLTKIWGGHDLWKPETTGESKEMAMSKIFLANGLPRMQQAKIDRVDGWRFLHRALDEGEWIITSNCIDAVRAIPTAIYDIIHPGKDEDVLKTATKDDDVLDELRYGLYSQASQQQVSLNVIIAQKAAHVADLTNRNILVMKLNHEYDLKNRNAGRVNSRSLAKYRRYAS